MLEKAYAKVYGNYEKIESAWSGDALRDLTGAYAKEHRKKNETPAEGDRLFGIVQKNLKSKYVIMTNSDKSNAGFETENKEGIISSHCYSILDAKIIKTQGGQ